MSWQMLLIVAQLGVGGGFVIGGLRLAAVHWLANRNRTYSDQLDRRFGRPLPRGSRPVLLGLLLLLVGAAMLATIDMTAGALRPPQPY